MYCYDLIVMSSLNGCDASLVCFESARDEHDLIRVGDYLALLDTDLSASTIPIPPQCPSCLLSTTPPHQVAWKLACHSTL